MLILALESSCDETAASVGRDGREILSNVVYSQIDMHALYGGVVPEIAGRAHIEAISSVVSEALESAGVTPRELDAVAVTSHPGLIGALLVGVNFAKALAYAYSLPIIPINHIHAHTAAAYITAADLKPPFLSLVVSGGHTSFYHVKDYTHYEEIGATRDDAAGEAFDKVGRVIGLPYPGGAALDALAREGNAVSKKPCVDLPSPALSGDNLDFSFSGIKTAALNYLNAMRQRGEEIDRPAFAAAFTNTVVGAIAKKVPSALRNSGCSTLVLAGGVAANSHLRAALESTCRKCGARLILPSLSYCGDNAAMVAAQGVYEFKAGNFADTYLNASACD